MQNGNNLNDKKNMGSENHMKKKHSIRIITALILLILSFSISYKYTVYEEESSKGSNVSIKDSDGQRGSEFTEGTDDKSSSVSNKIAHDYDEDYIVYNVKEGDCLSKIYKENIVGYTLSKARVLIIKKNNLKSEEDIKEGMELLIPQKDTDGWIEYRVRPKDSLYSIVKKVFGASDTQTIINEIRLKNSMDSSEEPEVDQRLLIPDSSSYKN